MFLFVFDVCNTHDIRPLPSLLHSDKIGDSCTTNTDCTDAFQQSTCSNSRCACVTGYRDIEVSGASQCIASKYDKVQQAPVTHQ